MARFIFKRKPRFFIRDGALVASINVAPGELILTGDAVELTPCGARPVISDDEREGRRRLLSSVTARDSL